MFLSSCSNFEAILDLFGSPPLGPKPEQDRTESEGLVRLRTCNREAVHTMCEVLRLLQKETSRGRQQETAISHSCKGTKECGRAGGTSVSMNTSVALVINFCLQVDVLGGNMGTCNQTLLTKWHLEHTLVPQELQNGALRVLLRSLLTPNMFNLDNFGHPRCSNWSPL